MQKAMFVKFGSGAVTLAGALLLASCSSQPPSQTTTINVEVPAAKSEDAATSNKTASSQPLVEIDESEEAQEARTAKPTAKNAASAPKPSGSRTAATSSSSRRSKSKLLDFYDRLPTPHFAAFGGVNRRSLLQRKGAIVDYKRNFIEIPGSADERNGDLHKLQITLFPNGDEPWCAVSRIVWPQGQTPGALDFYYGESDGDGLRKAAAGFFPYKLQRVGGAYESAWLPQRGLDIRINSAQDSEFNGLSFRYNRNFRIGEPAFKQFYEPEDG